MAGNNNYVWPVRRTPSADNAQVKIPKTGETGGAKGSESGVAWPSGRFVVGSGATESCVSDKLTGLMWPKNGVIGFAAIAGGVPLDQPNYTNTNPSLNAMNWSNAVTAVAKMNSALTKLCGYTDWRLPNVNELKSLINYGESDPMTWLGAKGFANVSISWSSTSYAPNNNYAWLVHFKNSDVNSSVKGSWFNVWPVRGGRQP